jgi:probable addiction module antidote protein
MRKTKTMSKAIDVDHLPELDPSQYLDNEESIAVFLTGILQANDAALLASALGDIARARGMTEIAKAAGITREGLYRAFAPIARHALIPSAASVQRSACV